MKIIITNKQYNTLVENITKNTDLDESIGEFVKSTIGRFSRKKSLSKNPIDVSVRNVFTRDLDAEIMKKDKEFPNNRSEVDFTNTLLRIKAVYEKIKLCAYLEPSDPEYLSVDDANWAIDTLIQYIYQIYDKNLKSVYKPLTTINSKKSKSRGGKLIQLVNYMRRVRDNEIPVHKPKIKPKSVPRGTSKKSTPPKPVVKPKPAKKPAKSVPTPQPASIPQPKINKGDMMWYRKEKVIVITPNIDSDHSQVRYDGENIPFPALNKELIPI
jgi:hypothetical protein